MGLTILKRRKCSGFVQWPPQCGRRILNGNATFQTPCDMLVGPCSCGHTHRETSSYVLEVLEDYGMELEIMELYPKGGGVRIPKYWEAIHNQYNKRCSHLVGKCMCGETHTGKEQRIKRILKQHFTVIKE